METDPSPLADVRETVGELRALYRSAEARAARLRLLIQASGDLSAATGADLDSAIAANAQKAAHFAGFKDGKVTTDPKADGVALIAPGAEGRRVGTLILTREEGAGASTSEEDQEALGTLAQMIATAMDRGAREAERDRLLARLRDREAQLERTVSRLFSAQEDERRYVSRELHDGVAQTATALLRRLEASVEGSHPQHDDLPAIAKGLVQELRQVIAGLRPVVLDDLGLCPAIERLASDLQGDGYQVRTDIPDATTFSRPLATGLYRVAQEAISNIKKHAGGPCAVDITLNYSEENGRGMLTIRDHGVGFSPDRDARPERGENVGIEMMTERMLALGGSLSINEANGGGVCVRAKIGSA
ncbi:sensor histidine kinase [Parvularcula bermudensis HTCC2503]|uniref:histidine kinase n=1 Tax=Parvularcula bermudensis (strain ATCC BAA-594 / HTCC2503 / KCTC 12087) TaxID=314260 RepID=E0TGG7_PARBH|nr:ATP-binding protein [Parvularcula bermudensis]ADM09586.1 sensor histidine kinase [Parvularcula bermudensis HTCC2503]